MNTKNYPIYHKQIDLERFKEVEAPRDRRKVLAIGVSESGHLAMNEYSGVVEHLRRFKLNSVAGVN